MQTSYFSIVFQITQECPFSCDICLRHYELGSSPLTFQQKLQMIEVLKSLNVKRLSVSGGEPAVLGNSLFDFLKRVHDEQIHICLSTTGYGLTGAIIRDMDNYLDQMLISIRSLEIEQWQKDFGNTKYTTKLFHTVNDILRWIRTTGIILEVNTVLHKENFSQVLRLGEQLNTINSNMIWRIDEYYGIGLTRKFKDRFELDSDEFEEARQKIQDRFSGKFKSIRFTSKYDRIHSPNFLIDQTGDLISSSNYEHKKTGLNILELGDDKEIFEFGVDYYA